MAKLTNIVRCPSRGCDRYFEIDYSDVDTSNPTGLRHNVRCPDCGSMTRISKLFFDSIKPKEKKEEKVSPRADTTDKKVAKAQRAQKALEEAGGNKTKAAEILGVSITTIINWLNYLPETAETVPGMVPSA